MHLCPAGTALAPQEDDRRALAQRADALAQLRQKVKRLEEMQGRNRRDKVMLPQIERALKEARAELAGAEAQHAASSKAIHDKEKLKKMVRRSCIRPCSVTHTARLSWGWNMCTQPAA